MYFFTEERGKKEVKGSLKPERTLLRMRTRTKRFLRGFVDDELKFTRWCRESSEGPRTTITVVSNNDDIDMLKLVLEHTMQMKYGDSKWMWPESFRVSEYLVDGKLTKHLVIVFNRDSAVISGWGPRLEWRDYEKYTQQLREQTFKSLETSYHR